MTNEMDIIIKEAQKGDFKIRVKFEYTDREFGKKLSMCSNRLDTIIYKTLSANKVGILLYQRQEIAFFLYYTFLILQREL